METRKHTEGGTKSDSAKPRVELISSIATVKKAKVMGFGAEKYGVDNWRKGLAWTRIIGALLRHTLSYLAGEDIDQETGQSHMAHAACCVDFLLEYEETHRELDDRFKTSEPDTAIRAKQEEILVKTMLCHRHKFPLMTDGTCPCCLDKKP